MNTVNFERKNIALLYIMSIVALKKKTAAKYNNMSVNTPQFSINGGYRNQGWVGQTSLSRSLPKTPMRGTAARGHGGCCDTYRETPIVQSAVTSTNNNRVIKASSLNTRGMLDSRYKWLNRPAPNTSVKPDDTHNIGTQQDYITRKAKMVINVTSKDDCPPMKKSAVPCASKCTLFKNRINTPYSTSEENITKSVGPADQSHYINNVSDKCRNVDVEFQKLRNKPLSNGPFGC